MKWLRRSSKGKTESKKHDAIFYFVFNKDDKAGAIKTEKELKALRFSTDLYIIDVNGGQWSITANKEVSGIEEALKLNKEFQEKYGRQYDGHEVEV